MIFHMCQYSSVFSEIRPKLSMKRFAYRQIIFQMVTKLSNLSPAFGKHAANQIPRNESGSVCNAAIFSETSAPFLMRGVFSIPQKSRAVFTARLKYFQHQKSVVPPPQKQPYAPRSERHCASAHTAAVQPNTRHGIRFSGSARSTSAPAAAKAKAKKKPERAPDAQMDGEKPMAP